MKSPLRLNDLPLTITLAEYGELELRHICSEVIKIDCQACQREIICELIKLLKSSSDLKMVEENRRDNLYITYNDFSKYEIDQSRKTYRDKPTTDIENIVYAAAKTPDGLKPLIEKALSDAYLPQTKKGLQSILRKLETYQKECTGSQSTQHKHDIDQNHQVAQRDPFSIEDHSKSNA